MFWLYSRPIEKEIESINAKFAKKPEIAGANVKAFHAGYNYGETTEVFTERYLVPAAEIERGVYRHATGNEVSAIGGKNG